jgi:hypothetical protein
MQYSAWVIKPDCCCCCRCCSFRYLSVDPYMRGMMRDTKVRGFGIHAILSLNLNQYMRGIMLDTKMRRFKV